MVRPLVRFSILPREDLGDLMPRSPATLFVKETSLVIDLSPFKVNLVAREW